MIKAILGIEYTKSCYIIFKNLKLGDIYNGRYQKREQRDELHRTIWAIADELRGSVDRTLKTTYLVQCFIAIFLRA